VGILGSNAAKHLVLTFALLAVSLCSHAGSATSAQAETNPPPNILFVLTDDQNEKLFTRQTMPNVFSKVVSGGTRFTNFYVTQPLCCPSRATYLTGKYSHNHGVTSLASPDGGEQRFRLVDDSTIATALDPQYETVYVGKYLNGYRGRYVPPGWDRWAAQVRLEQGWGLNRNGTVRPVSGYSTSVYREAAVRFLKGSANSPDPFFLYFATNAPHLPAVDPNGVPRVPRPDPGPAFNEKDVSDKPRWIRNTQPLDNEMRRTALSGLSAQANSLGPVDRAVDEMLSILERQGELENTYVIFTSDNGTFAGEHRYYGTRGVKSVPYEEAASVPLAIRGPGIPAGETRTGLAANNDLAPTIASWTGVEMPGADGRDLSPLLSSEDTPGRDSLLLESRRVRKESRAPNFDALVTSDGFKYVEWATGEKELYDLSRDSYELDNLLASETPPDTDDFSDRLVSLRSCAGDSCRVAEGP
jgi:N-acetylglucosamine-6-sulfatase